MHFFGLYGTLFFLAGFVYDLLPHHCQNYFRPILHLPTGPSFYIALTTMIIGMQLFLAGFIAELIARNAQNEIAI